MGVLCSVEGEESAEKDRVQCSPYTTLKRVCALVNSGQTNKRKYTVLIPLTVACFALIFAVTLTLAATAVKYILIQTAHNETIPALIFAVTLTLAATAIKYIFIHAAHNQTIPALIVATEQKEFYREYRAKLFGLLSDTTHLEGQDQRTHDLQVQYKEGLLIFRHSNLTLKSHELSSDDYRLYLKGLFKFAIPVCNHWNDKWQPVNYNCSWTLVRTVPILLKMDQAASSNSGINFLETHHVSAPTLLVSSGILLVVIIVISCCCCITNLAHCGSSAFVLQKCKPKKPENNLRSLEPTLNSLIHASTQSQPRAGHI